MTLPKNDEHRRALIRRVLEGRQVIFPVLVWQMLGGRHRDFGNDEHLAMTQDLRVLGYVPSSRPGRIAISGHTLFAWYRDEPWDEDCLPPFPMPTERLADEDGELDEVVPFEAAMSFLRDLEETYR